MFLFIYFQKMPNTKITKAKSRDKCPLCEQEVQDNKWREHLLMCNGGKFPCKICGKLFKKSSYLQRHEKKFHQAEVLEKRTEDDKEWLEQDPGELIGEVSNESEPSSSSSDSSEDEEVVGESKMIQSERDNERQEPQESKQVEDKAGEENSSFLEKGRIIRKPTIPVPVFAPQRRVPISLPDKNVPLNRFKFSSKCSTSTQTEDVGHVAPTRIKKRKLHKTTLSYVKDDKNVEEIIEEEEFEYEN